jgi:serine phosphatase RsbU (regulator of sigma subunit)
MEIQVAAAKVNKYAVSESGDSLEVVERPHGGLSVVLADGQSSGRGAKAISLMVVRKVIGLLAEGVRDGAAARAASDMLFAEKGGKVSCTLNIASLDLVTRTLVLARNNPASVFVATGETVDRLEGASQPIGIYRNTKPVITEIPIAALLTVVFFTDGLVHAGSRRGTPMDVGLSLQSLLEEEAPSAQEIADALLGEALRVEDGRPSDDCSVVVLRVIQDEQDNIRRMSVRLPFEVR